MMVGSERLISTLDEGLKAGPRDHRFVTLLTGPRGSGKTVMLNTIRDMVLQDGWIVLRADASKDDIRDSIAENLTSSQLFEAALQLQAPERGEARTSTTLKIPMFQWQKEVVRHIHTRWTFEKQLRTLCKHASQHNAGVLLLVDELHGGERKALRGLFFDIQNISKSDNMPLAFLGAGLSEMKHSLLEDNRMTFLQRCNRENMPRLTQADAARFFRKTISDAGGAFAGKALERLSGSAGTLPFRLQLLGYYAWAGSNAPDQPIDDASASIAIAETDRVMHDLAGTDRVKQIKLSNRLFAF